MTNEEIIAGCLAPILGDNPGGTNIRYDAEFQRIEEEMRKIESPAGGTVDWRTVQNDCMALLSNRSKDLLLVAYLVRSLFEAQRMVGLSIGLKACQDVLTVFWDNLEPARVRARRSALEWMSERVALVLIPGDVASPQGQDALTATISTLDAIYAWSVGRFEEDDCGLSVLRRRLNELRGSIVVEGAAETGASSTGAVGGRSGPIANRSDAIARLNDVADFFSRTEPHSPIGFLVSRAVSWSQKSFQEVFVELLKGRNDAQEQMWDSLGLKPPEQTNG